MKNFERLNRNEMKMIIGGVDAPPEEGETCNCNNKEECTTTEKPNCYNCGSNGSGGQKYGYCNK